MLRHRLEKVESMGDEAQRGSKSVPKPAPKQVYCDVCDVYLSSAALVDTHKNGRKHTNLVKVKADKASVQKKTIFVRGFDKSLITCADLEQLFSQFGEIRNIYIDKEKNCYALVEFETDASVAKVLNQTEPLTLNDKTLKVKPKSSPKKVEKKPDHTNPSSSPVSPGSKKRKRGTSQSELSNFVTSELFKGLNSSNTVEEQISVLMEHLGLSKDDLQLRDLICQLLAGVFQEFFPTCSVMPYGSSANGLGWKGSDLDLCLLLDNNPSEEDLSKDGVKQCADELGIVVKALKDLVPGCAHVVPVFSAKCPVVKFVHQPSGVSCDLTINNRLGMENTKLLRCYLSLDPRVKQLITVARAWARAAGLSRDRGGHLSNYALTLMAVYFLQITSPPVIPSLQCINKWLLLSSSTTPAHENCNCEQAKFIDGWDCSYFDDVTRVSSSENSCDIVQLLTAFFDFYGNRFDYGNCVVNIRTGQHCTKLAIQEELQEVMRSRTKGDNAMSLPKIVEFDLTDFCVQDPFELSHNVTRSLSTMALKDLIKYMMTAREVCKRICPLEYFRDTKGIIALLTTSCGETRARKLEQCSFDVPLAVGKDSPDFTSEDDLLRDVLRFLTEDLKVHYEVEKTEITSKELQDKDGLLNEVLTSSDSTLDNPERFPSSKVECIEKFPDSILLIATCTAWENTWTHSRRQRRRIIAERDGSQEKSHLQGESPSVDGDVSPSSSRGTALPVLVFRLVYKHKADQDRPRASFYLHHVRSQGFEDCRKANFGAVQEDKVLTGAVLATYAVFSEFECRVKCYTNHECLSVNLGPQVNGLRQCELNGAINDEETVLQSKMGFMYRGFKSNPCLSTPCKNGATCHVGFTSKGFRCLCAQGYQGSRCDDDKDECRTKGVCGNVSLYACVNTYGSYSCQCAAGYSQVGSTCTEATMPASANTTAISASTMATSANTTAISASTMATSANTTATSTSTMATSAITTATPISTMATLTSTMATPASTTATSASATATPTST
ncbi:uncharacterized protein LOC5521762 isoform X2 [Nematostella vectensis]|uniref:uncharacterized protein LOC5521762 isoform X2 n=1 Tax=Nematostella vectensis TaxID=45351 RepID=UPI0020778D16|nr:uncharacterized protein LOC5521762 isoform X2 [Nematostella vectensis]